MLKLYSMKLVAFAATGWKPESRPVALKFVHGLANVDWVMVWFFVKLFESLVNQRPVSMGYSTYNWKAMVSPFWAVTSDGL